MKGVGSIRRATLRGGLRFRGGTVMESSEEVVEANNRVVGVVVVEDFWMVVVAMVLDIVEAGENADEVEMAASEAMAAAE